MRRARGGEASRQWRDAERHQQPTVVARLGLEHAQDGGVARGFTRDDVLARGQVRQRVEEEDPLGQRRHQTQPQVPATDVHQLVADRHLLLRRRQAGPAS